MDHAHANSAGESHGSQAAYLRGFILSVMLTAAAFASHCRVSCPLPAR